MHDYQKHNHVTEKGPKRPPPATAQTCDRSCFGGFRAIPPFSVTHQKCSNSHHNIAHSSHPNFGHTFRSPFRSPFGAPFGAAFRARPRVRCRFHALDTPCMRCARSCRGFGADFMPWIASRTAQPIDKTKKNYVITTKQHIHTSMHTSIHPSSNSSMHPSNHSNHPCIHPIILIILIMHCSIHIDRSVIS